MQSAKKTIFPIIVGSAAKAWGAGISNLFDLILGGFLLPIKPFMIYGDHVGRGYDAG